jgi:hypothetical protein
MLVVSEIVDLTRALTPEQPAATAAVSVVQWMVAMKRIQCKWWLLDTGGQDVTVWMGYGEAEVNCAEVEFTRGLAGTGLEVAFGAGYCFTELNVGCVAGAPEMSLWDDILWSVNVRQYVCNFRDFKPMKSRTRELDLTMRGESLRRILNPSHGPGCDRHPPYEKAPSRYREKTYVVAP